MAKISINIQRDNVQRNKSNISTISRLEAQTPLDFAISHLPSLGHLYKFLKAQGLSDYVDFYTKDEYLIPSYRNIMKLNGYESATRPQFYFSQDYDFNVDFNTDFNS